MIVCHEHRFVFLKTNKTAGTSAEIALSTVCSDSDIITPVSPPDETLRREYGGHPPANYLRPWRDYSMTDWRRLLLKRRRKLRFYNHIPAREARPLLGEKIWGSYFKFCFERNPWDRVVSYYYWYHRRGGAPSLSEFVASDRPLVLKRRGIGLYTIDGELAVDRVCRFEDIKGELDDVAAHLRLPKALELPRAKSGIRKERTHYRDVLSGTDRERIAVLFADEIRLLRYTY